MLPPLMRMLIKYEEGRGSQEVRPGLEAPGPRDFDSGRFPESVRPLSESGANAEQVAEPDGVVLGANRCH